MTKGTGIQIGTDAKPMILCKKRRRPNINSQAYKDNYDKIFGKREEKWKKDILKEEHQLSLTGMN